MGEAAKATEVLIEQANRWLRAHEDDVRRHAGNLIAVRPADDTIYVLHFTGDFSEVIGELQRLIQARRAEATTAHGRGRVLLIDTDLFVADLRRLSPLAPEGDDTPFTVTMEEARALLAAAVRAESGQAGGLTSPGGARIVAVEMTASAAPSQPPTDHSELRALYEGVDAPTVAEHLVAHPELVPVLVEAAPRLRAAYGEGARLRLEPAFFEGEEMFARVYGHGLTAEEADARGAAFDAWWLAVDPRLDAARRWLEFGVGWGA